MKKIILLFFITLLLIMHTNIYAYTHDNTIKLYDYAQVLTESDQTILKEKINDFVDKNKIDMVVVALRHYSTNTIESYAEEFYNTYNYGIGDTKSGIILVLDLYKNESYIKVFGDSNKLYTKDEIDIITKNVSASNNNYTKIYNFVRYSDEFINKNYEYSNSNINNIFITILVSILIPTIVCIILLFKSKNKVNTHLYYNHLKPDSLVINTKRDEFINTNTKQIKL